MDLTALTPEDKAELKRSNSGNLPVNLLYPPNYPDDPAIMLPEFIWPSQALEALNRVAPESDEPSETVEAANDSDQDQANAG